MPDLVIPEWNLWIEMKRQSGGRVSSEQKDWHKYLISIGHTVGVCKGFEQAKRFIERLRSTSRHSAPEAAEKETRGKKGALK